MIAALTFSTSLWAPRPALAGSISGTWTGEVSTTTYYLLDGALVGSSSSNDLGQMSLTYDPSQYVVWMTIGGNEIAGMPVTDPYGTDARAQMVAAQQVYGSIYPGPNYYGLPVGNYIVSYPSLLPDGSIDTSSGFADGDIDEVNADNSGTGEILYISFQTLPEPASIV